MINEKVAKLLNEQVQKEFFSAYLYYAIANYYVEEGLMGFANWFTHQAAEEQGHATKIVGYMQENDLKVELLTLDQPKLSVTSYAEPLSLALEHEKYITASINAIYEAATEGKDYRTAGFMEYFIREQAEEEANAIELVRKMELFGKDSQGLYLLNQELGGRK